MTAAQNRTIFRPPHRNGSTFPQPNFHLAQNENRHFTLCLQGCGGFHARKIGEPPTTAARPDFLNTRQSLCDEAFAEVAGAGQVGGKLRIAMGAFGGLVKERDVVAR